jgi:hypothetical protein
MNSVVNFLTKLYADYVKYAPAIGMIATGVALICAKNYGPGVQAVLQGIAMIAAGSTAMALHYAVRDVPKGVLEEARRR